MNLPKTYLIILVLVIAVIGLGIYSIQITGENNSKDDALELFRNNSEADLKQLEKERDSIAEVAEKYRKEATTDFNEGQDLEDQKEQLKNEDYENEPYRINNADSLRDIIARRFN